MPDVLPAVLRRLGAGLCVQAGSPPCSQPRSLGLILISFYFSISAVLQYRYKAEASGEDVQCFPSIAHGPNESFFFSPIFFTANPLGCSEADHLVIGGVFVVLRGVFKLEKQLVWIL